MALFSKNKNKTTLTKGVMNSWVIFLKTKLYGFKNTDCCGKHNSKSQAMWIYG